MTLAAAAPRVAIADTFVSTSNTVTRTPAISGADRARLNIRDTADVEAYRHYMKGRYFWDKRSAEGMQKVQEHFEQAIAIDPNYALAYAGLADCFALTDASPSPHSEGYAKAKSAAIQALALDETLAEAHTSLAWIKFNYEWDWGAQRTNSIGQSN